MLSSIERPAFFGEKAAFLVSSRFSVEHPLQDPGQGHVERLRAIYSFGGRSAFLLLPARTSRLSDGCAIQDLGRVQFKELRAVCYTGERDDSLRPRTGLVVPRTSVYCKIPAGAKLRSGEPSAVPEKEVFLW